jgi:hypothetical protein
MAVDSVPDRKDHLGTSVDLTRRKTSQLSLRPLLGEECGTEDNDAKASPCERCFDAAIETVAYGQFQLVEPYFESAVDQNSGKRPRDVLLVLAGMADEEIGCRQLSVRSTGRRSCVIGGMLSVPLSGNCVDSFV